MISRFQGCGPSEMSKIVSTPAKRHAPRKFDAAWRLQVTAQSFRPGMLVREVAKQHGVGSNLLSYWRKKYGAQVRSSAVRVPRRPQATQFAPVSVSVANDGASTGVEIVLADGIRVRSVGTVDVTALAQVLTLLRR